MDTVENKFDAQLTKPAAGNWGKDLDGKDGARQALPNPDLQNDGAYDAVNVLYSAASDDQVLLGEDVDGESALKDDDYPTGIGPATFAADANGSKWNDLSFDSVAPYKYPDFGKWPNGNAGFNIGGRSDLID